MNPFKEHINMYMFDVSNEKIPKMESNIVNSAHNLHISVERKLHFIRKPKIKGVPCNCTAAGSHFSLDASFGLFV